MSTNFIYKDNDIANLTAKNCGETLSGVSYMNPSSQTDFKFDIESSKRYWFIPYSTSILGGLWAAKKVAYSSAFDSGSSNSTKIENAAAWGSAPIPKRWGLNNLNSPYIDSTKVEFSSGYKYIISWNTSTSCTELKKYNSSGSLVETTTMTKAPCLVIDVVAKGGDGGAGWKKTTLTVPWAGGGGGGGSGAGASLLVDLSKAGSIIFDNTSASSRLAIQRTSGATFLTLNAGSNGDSAKDGAVKEGGAGGSVSTGTLPTGVKILWSKAGGAGGGAYGGSGNGYSTGGYKGTAGDNGASFREKITFISDNWMEYQHCGEGGIKANYTHGGGGGAASFIGVGGTGKSVLAVTSPGLGGGGGGGYGDVSRSSNGSCSTGSPGGSAGAIFYYESYTDRLYSTTAVTNRDSGSGPEIDSGDDDNPGSSGGSSGGTVGGGGCVFPGTQIYLNKDTSVDIVNFTGGTPIDFCNPDTLEHFQQQTLVSCFYKRATKKVIITLEDGKNIALTTNHAILTSEGFKTYFTTINNFPLYSIGDQVATVDGYKKISMIQEENINETTVYNIVTENSLMVANGIIVAGELNLNIDVTAISGPSVDKELGKP